jgi:sugar phosphate isomerase/epimerase
MAMKLAFSTLGCPAWTIEQVTAQAVHDGYQGVELRIYKGAVIPADLALDERRHVRSVFADAGVEICCVSASTRFSSADPTDRKKQEDELCRYVQLADDLGSPLVRTFGGMMPEGVAEDSVFRYVGDSLNRVADRTAGAKASVVLETHDAFSSGKAVATVLQYVASPRVGALWDTHHPYRTGETADQTYQLLKDRLLHTHVKDARRKGDGWQLVLLGEGEVPVRDVLLTLKANGYASWVCVEWEKMWHKEIEEPEVAFPQHAQTLRAYLSEDKPVAH